MIIGLSGYASSGKDTVGAYLVEKYGFTRYAFADALKEMAYALNPIITPDVNPTKPHVRLAELVEIQGWDYAKTLPEVRRILQVLGTECGRDILDPNVWVDILERRLRWCDTSIIITDVRFPNEVAFVKERGVLWWVERQKVNALNSHASENSVGHIDSDLVIQNNGSLEELYFKIDTWMRGIPALPKGFNDTHN